MKLLSNSFHLALDLAIPRFGVLGLRRIYFLVIALGRYIVALILVLMDADFHSWSGDLLDYS